MQVSRYSVILYLYVVLIRTNKMTTKTYTGRQQSEHACSSSTKRNFDFTLSDLFIPHANDLFEIAIYLSTVMVA